MLLMLRLFSKNDWLLPLLLYLALSVIYLFAIPVGESPDEPGHLQCIEQVALYERAPVVEPAPHGEVWWARTAVISGRMCYHMPLYYLINGYLLRFVAQLTDTPVHFELPPSNPLGPEPAMFIHTPKPLFWHIPESLTVTVLRLLSIGFSMGVVVGSYGVTRLLFPQENNTPLLAALLTSAWPQFVYLGRSINNDVLVTAVAVGILVILLQVGNPKRFIWAGLLGGLVVLTKVSLLFTLAAIIFSWLVETWFLPQQRRQYVWALVVCLAVWAGIGLLILWHPTLNLHFSQSLGQFAQVPERVKEVSYWQDVFTLTLSSGWARFGWMNVAVADWQAYVAWGGVAITAVIGIIFFFRQSPTPHHRLQLVIVTTWLAGVLFSYIRINMTLFQPQFRFMMAAMPILMAFAATGSVKWISSHLKQQRFIGLIIGLFVGYNLWLIFNLIIPAYY